MQTKSRLARIAAALAIAVVLPLAILITMAHSGKKPLAKSVVNPGLVASNASAKLTPEEAQKVADQFGRLPMSFEPNHGQKSSEVKFYSHGPGYEVFLTNQEAVMAVHHPPAKSKSATLLATRRPSTAPDKVSYVRMKLNGANNNAQITGDVQLPGKVNYFIGNDPSKWHTDISTFGAVKYSAVYPGIDLVYYGNQKQLEYDFVVAPGGDPKSITFNVTGAKTLRVDNRGDLLLNTANGNVTFQKPVVYQEVAGERKEVAGNYVVGANHEVHFAVGAYDPSKTLTIDPSVLIYSTYLGGSGVAGDFGYSIALDSQGDAWVAGNTSSSDFPVANSLPTPPEIGSAFSAAFVTELNATGTSFLYSSYLGGSGNGSGGDGAQGLALDANGNVYLTGYTESADFPVSTNAYQAPPNVPASVAGLGSAFVTALHPATAGSAQLVYSSFLGGNGANGGLDEAWSIATDGNGNAYVTGVTTSTDFPTLNPIVATANSAAGNAFLTEINTAAATGPASLVFSTYLGGSGSGGTPSGFPFGDYGFGVTLDSSGSVYVTGATTSSDFAPAPAGGTACGDGGYATAFLVKINAAATPPASTFSACFGGAAGDTLGNAIAIAPDKTAVITGQTYTNDIVPTNVIPTPTGVPNASASLVFLVKYNTTGSPAIAYSTLFGGENGDAGYGVATDSTGNIYIGGGTASAKFPITQGALIVTNSNGSGTGFVTKLNPAGGGASDILYSTYFGGAGQVGDSIPDAINHIAVSSSNNAYITGQTSSASTGATPFPVTSTAPLKTLGSGSPANAFIAELPLVPTISISPVTLDFGTQPLHVPTAAQYVAITNNTLSAVSLTIPPTISGSADFAYTATAGSAGPACTTSIAAGSICTVGVIFTPTANGSESATMLITDGDDGPNHKLTVTLTGAGGNAVPAVSLSATNLTFAGTLIGATSAPQTVTVTNSGTAALVFGAGAITSTGANFTVGSDTCSGTSVAPTAACTFAVTLAPPTGASPGATSATIQIANNANGSPQSVAVSGTVWDFSLTVPATATVNRGTNTSMSVLINGLGGFAGSVGVACSSAASNIATCAVSPSSGTPTQTVTVTITGVSTVLPLNSPNGMPPFSVRQIVFAVIAMMLLFVIPMTRRTRTRLGLAAAMLVFAVVAGCSGSTKTKTTTLTITGTVGTVSKTYTTSVAVGG